MACSGNSPITGQQLHKRQLDLIYKITANEVLLLFFCFTPFFSRSSQIPLQFPGPQRVISNPQIAKWRLPCPPYHVFTSSTSNHASCTALSPEWNHTANGLRFFGGVLSPIFNPQSFVNLLPPHLALRGTTSPDPTPLEHFLGLQSVVLSLMIFMVNMLLMLREKDPNVLRGYVKFTCSSSFVPPNRIPCSAS